MRLHLHIDGKSKAPIHSLGAKAPVGTFPMARWDCRPMRQATSSAC